jgi:hypothetical protein
MSSDDLFWVRARGDKVTFRSACRLAGQRGLRHSMSVAQGALQGAIAGDDPRPRHWRGHMARPQKRAARTSYRICTTTHLCRQ